jgi:hypothetical protein
MTAQTEVFLGRRLGDCHILETRHYGQINRLLVDWPGVVPRNQPNGRVHFTVTIGGMVGFYRWRRDMVGRILSGYAVTKDLGAS